MKETDTDTDTDADTDTDTDTDSDLPDLVDDLEDGDCEEVLGTVSPGATSWFYGEYSYAGDDTYVGYELWILMANDALQAASADDFEDYAMGEGCRAQWSAVASVGAPVSCSGCDLSLSVTATMDASETDCPEGITYGEENFETIYDVDLAADGGSSWYYASSGGDLGNGHHDESSMNFVTDASCLWF